MQPTVGHGQNAVDFSYSFNMQRFLLVDHFLVSQQLFHGSIAGIHVLHEIDNLSDHEPVCIDFRISVQCYGVQARSFVSKVGWQKARSDQLDVYATALRDVLSKLAIPHAAIVCSDVHCQDPSHRACLYKYINELFEACLTAAKHTLPYTSLRSILKGAYRDGLSMWKLLGRNCSFDMKCGLTVIDLDQRSVTVANIMHTRSSADADNRLDAFSG